MVTDGQAGLVWTGQSADIDQSAWSVENSHSYQLRGYITLHHESANSMDIYMIKDSSDSAAEKLMLCIVIANMMVKPDKEGWGHR